MEHVKGGFREEGRGTASLQGRAHYHCYNHVQGETESKGDVTISSVKTSISTDMAYKTK